MMKRLFAVVLFALLLISPAIAADKIVRVAVLPFNSSEAKEYAALTDTLTSMLTSRIASGGGVELVDYPFAPSELNRLRNLDAAHVPAQLPKMRADFLVKGNLYTVQSGLQLHLSVIPLDGKSEPSNFSAFAGAENQIIPAVVDLAQSASRRLRGDVLPAETPPGLAEKTGAATGASGFDTEHPDRIYQRLAVSSGKGPVAAEPGVLQAEMRRGEPVKVAANAMAVGDLDGDGKQEVVLATDGTLRVFSFDDKMNASPLASYSFPLGVRVNMVSVARLDGQPGLAIYVSASQKTQPYGAIFVYSPSAGLLAKMKDIPWYIRPIDRPGEGVQLFGQRGDDHPETGYLGKGVHRLRLQPDLTALTDEGAVPLPAGIGLFDFVWLDLNGDGKLEVAAIDGNSKLKIFNSQGELLWVSENEYGGSKNFIGPSLANDDTAQNNSGLRLLRYIPGRILVMRGNDDGKDEIIVGANQPTFLNTWLRNSREYDGGRLHHLFWDGSGMRESWKTGELNGYIADYGLPQPEAALKDSLQLIVAQRPGRTLLGFTLDDTTALVSYRISLQQGKAVPGKAEEKGAKSSGN